MSAQSGSVGALFGALAKAQGGMKGALKDSQNPYFKSSYADLASVWDACRAELSKNGLSVIQTTRYEPETGMCVVTTLGHSSGEWIQGVYPVMALKREPQGVGAAITYARRYALAAIVGIAQVDDDGEQAMGRRGVYPEQPDSTRDGTSYQKAGAEPYRIPFGKFAKRGLEEIDLKDLVNYVNYIETKAEKDGKPIAGQVAEFIARASEYINAFERGAATDFGQEMGSEV